MQIFMLAPKPESQKQDKTSDAFSGEPYFSFPEKKTLQKKKLLTFAEGWRLLWSPSDFSAIEWGESQLQMMSCKTNDFRHHTDLRYDLACYANMYQLHMDCFLAYVQYWCIFSRSRPWGNELRTLMQHSSKYAHGGGVPRMPGMPRMPVANIGLYNPTKMS